MFGPQDLGVCLPLAVVQVMSAGQACGNAAWPVSAYWLENQNAVGHFYQDRSLPVWLGCRPHKEKGYGEVTQGSARGWPWYPRLPLEKSCQGFKNHLSPQRKVSFKGDPHFAEFFQKPLIYQYLPACTMLSCVSVPLCMLSLLPGKQPICLIGQLK